MNGFDRRVQIAGVVLLVVCGTLMADVIEVEGKEGEDPQQECGDNCNRDKSVVGVDDESTTCYFQDDPAGQSQELQDFFDCVVGAWSAPGGYDMTAYPTSPYPIGVDVTSTVDGPQCLGMNEEHPDIGGVTISILESGRVALLGQFESIDNPYGPTATNTSTSVHLEISYGSAPMVPFVVSIPTTYAMDHDDLNSAVVNAINANSDLSIGSPLGVGAPYWIISDETGYGIWRINARYDDPRLHGTWVELRPDASDYSEPCGSRNF